MRMIIFCRWSEEACGWGAVNNINCSLHLKYMCILTRVWHFQFSSYGQREDELSSFLISEPKHVRNLKSWHFHAFHRMKNGSVILWLVDVLLALSTVQYLLAVRKNRDLKWELNSKMDCKPHVSRTTYHIFSNGCLFQFCFVFSATY